MAFVKNPLNATTPREIIEYSQDLEGRIEDGFDDLSIKTQNVSLLAGWSGTLELYKQGAYVSVQGNMSVPTGATISNGTVVANIPEGYRPNKTVSVSASFSNMEPFTSYFVFWLLPNGQLTIRTDATILTGTARYITANTVYFSDR